MSVLERIHSPADVKALERPELDALARSALPFHGNPNEVMFMSRMPKSAKPRRMSSDEMRSTEATGSKGGTS